METSNDFIFISTVKQIRLTCGQEIEENENNLFGEKVYLELLVNVTRIDDSKREKSIKMGDLLCSNTGCPLMIFLGISLLKDKCSKLFLRGSYVRNKIFITREKFC
jgi:hypothetical protein